MYKPGPKYPLMYEVSDVLVINKIDALPVFDFRKDYVEACAKRLNPQIKIFYISAKTGEGVKRTGRLSVGKDTGSECIRC